MTLAAFNTQHVDTIQHTVRGDISVDPLMITNIGTIALVFDSITCDDPNFSLVHTVGGAVPIGGTVIDSIKFHPVEFGWLRAQIIFYTNSVSSPDTIIGRGLSWGAGAHFTPRKLEFGLIPAGASKESSVVLSNIGNSAMRGLFTSSNPAFMVPDSYAVWGNNGLRPNDSVRIRIRYTATTALPESGLVLFSYIENSMGPDTIYLTGSVDPSGAISEDEVPPEFRLEQNYPNPFNPETRIQYTVAGTRGSELGARKTALMVYDVLGRRVATLVDEVKAPGSYEVTFDGSGLASGVYVYRMTSGAYTESRKMILVR